MKKKRSSKWFVLFLCFCFCPSALWAQDVPVEKSKIFLPIDLLDIKQMDVLELLKLISQKTGANIVATQGVQGQVTVYIKEMNFNEALTIILDAYGWAFTQEGDTIRVMTGQEYEQRFGNKFGQEMVTKMYDLKYISSTDMSSLLSQIKSASGKIIADDKRRKLIISDIPKKIGEMEKIIAQFDSPVETKVFELSYVKEKDLAGKIEPILTPGLGTIRSDERSNRIVVRDIPAIIEQIEKVIQAFDAKHTEVLVEAKIVQVVLDDSHKWGVNWQAIVAEFKQLTFKSNFDILGVTDKRGTVSIGTLSKDDYQGLLEALNTMGKTNILSSPHITVLNNQEAKILVGSSEPYVTSTTTTTATGPATTAESVTFLEIGVKLYVTPTIHPDGYVTMKIKPEISSSTGEITTSNNNIIPIIETSEAETTVMVKDGVTIIIGGLIKEEKVKTVKSVPIFGKIPLLGMAFRNESDSVKKTEIAIFLRPTIITGDVSAEESNIK